MSEMLADLEAVRRPTGLTRDDAVAVAQETRDQKYTGVPEPAQRGRATQVIADFQRDHCPLRAVALHA